MKLGQQDRPASPAGAGAGAESIARLEAKIDAIRSGASGEAASAERKGGALTRSMAWLFVFVGFAALTFFHYILKPAAGETPSLLFELAVILFAFFVALAVSMAGRLFWTLGMDRLSREPEIDAAVEDADKRRTEGKPAAGDAWIYVAGAIGDLGWSLCFAVIFAAIVVAGLVR